MNKNLYNKITKDINKFISKYYKKKGNYNQDISFTLNIPKFMDVSMQEFATSKIIVSYDKSVWNQASDEKGWLNPKLVAKSIAYANWYAKEDLTWITSLPKIEKKSYNGIYSVQINRLVLNPKNGAVKFELSAKVVSGIGFAGWESGNNHGWTRIGVKSITLEYREDDQNTIPLELTVDQYLWYLSKLLKYNSEKFKNKRKNFWG